MKITHEEAMRRAHQAHEEYLDAEFHAEAIAVFAAAIEQAVKETAEECARMVYERSAAEPGEMRDEILAAFGIAEVKRGKQNDSHSPSRSPEECGVSGSGSALMKAPAYFVDSVQRAINIGLNGFALTMMAESFADKAEKFGSENVVFLAHAHSGQEVWFIMTKERPRAEWFAPVQSHANGEAPTKGAQGGQK